MRYLALATDYDETLATEGKVLAPTVRALKSFSETGRKLILITGREIQDLCAVFPEIEYFDLVIAENGAELYWPRARVSRLIADEPSLRLVERLKEKQVRPLSVGKSVIATLEVNRLRVLEALTDLKLERNLIANKGSLMILPPKIDKESGLREALRELSLKASEVIGVGDGENDEAFLKICGFSATVENALPSLKSIAHYVLKKPRGRGVEDLIMEAIRSDDLFELAPPIFNSSSLDHNSV